MKTYRVLTVISTWQDVEAEDKDHALEVAAAIEGSIWDACETEVKVTELRNTKPKRAQQ